MFAEQRWDVIPGGESMESLGGRVRASIERIVAETGPDAVAAAVVHGAVIGELCRQATDSRAFAFVHSDNGSISRLVVLADGRWQLRSFNDISHLAVRTAPIL
jgi:probable phosphoglycerate mutase